MEILYPKFNEGTLDDKETIEYNEVHQKLKAIEEQEELPPDPEDENKKKFLSIINDLVNKSVEYKEQFTKENNKEAEDFFYHYPDVLEEEMLKRNAKQDVLGGYGNLERYKKNKLNDLRRKADEFKEKNKIKLIKELGQFVLKEDLNKEEDRGFSEVCEKLKISKNILELARREIYGEDEKEAKKIILRSFLGEIGEDLENTENHEVRLQDSFFQNHLQKKQERFYKFAEKSGCIFSDKHFYALVNRGYDLHKIPVSGNQGIMVAGLLFRLGVLGVFDFITMPSEREKYQGEITKKPLKEVLEQLKKEAEERFAEDVIARARIISSREKSDQQKVAGGQEMHRELKGKTDAQTEEELRAEWLRLESEYPSEKQNEIGKKLDEVMARKNKKNQTE
ncbi:MAG: hypothetical protein A3D44_02755 [Candidatus Staskawiczbacteria bacterium RIFCSPHIGHO2_02_FULL_42_22]|uniref:Uncharacterized protein n=1 Tax=Candidatus Staskawiczbacteria bacterium RIFCSPHIGHO2_02_FULL_42_22 TaxID=1802207 RepID=A0A1G2I3M8_9BACT|nr:MAG: hypothetical protein A3D44_02755 [Candidatus Staskawiczbacteria bacterium RIFCSPHIGHO2_02_FULL_42_22]